MDRDELDSPLSQPGDVSSGRALSRYTLKHRSVSKDRGERLENERNLREDACVRDERTGCCYLIAPPRRPLFLSHP